jgi:pilus assembly protein FimV
MAALMSKWAAIIAGSLALVGGALFWFMRRGSDDEGDDGEALRPLDGDDVSQDFLSATETLRVPDRIEDSIMVVEQTSAVRPEMDVTVDAPLPEFEPAEPTFEPAEPTFEPAEPAEDTGSFNSLEDTFSSETAINLDQSDPMAEADFHMAYGLYDQAADLINGALEVESDSTELLTKLCEIYFVWGNRESFVDAAGRLKAATDSGDSTEWDKIVIMGQQIAADDVLFAGASAVGATKEVDLSFEAGAEEGGELDMEFTGEADESADIFDLGDSEDTVASGADDDDIFGDSADVTVDVGIDEDDDTSISAVLQTPDFDLTAAMPEIDVTAEMPAADATEEINVDDLGLDISGLAETELAPLDDLDVTSDNVALSDTGINEELQELADATAKNLKIDGGATGLQAILGEADPNMLDATGATQVLSDDFAVDTKTDFGESLSDADATMHAPDPEDAPEEDEETLLASLDDDEPEGDFDFAKTEALPKDAFIGDMGLDVTSEVPAVASTDVNLDLDDLTAALKVSEMDDTIEQPREDETIAQPRDDATVEQPRPVLPDPDDDTSGTMSLSDDDMSDDLHDARTMTEVGTKLDLARAYVDMGDPAGARSILEEVLDEGDEEQRQQAQQLLDTLPS